MTEEQAQVQNENVSEDENGSEEPQEPPYFVAKTKDEYEATFGPTRQEGRNALLKRLGFEKPEDAEAFVSEYRTIQDATKTDIEKLNERISTLEPEAKKAERYEGALSTFLERERDGVPAHVLKLLDRMDPVEQLSYLSEHRADFMSPSSVGGGTNPGQTATEGGPPDVSTMSSEEFEAFRQRVKSGERITL